MMWTNRATWPKASQWNRFRYIKCEDVDYGYDILVTTKLLTLKDIPEEQLLRLRLIELLYSQGLNSVQISDHMNETGIVSPKGLSYNPTLIWVTHDKFQKRKKRILDTKVTVDQDYFFVKDKKTLN